MRDYFASELEQLKELEQRGLDMVSNEGLEVTAMGWYFVRAIAMVFDRYLQADKNRTVFADHLTFLAGNTPPACFPHWPAWTALIAGLAGGSQLPVVMRRPCSAVVSGGRGRKEAEQPVHWANRAVPWRRLSAYHAGRILGYSLVARWLLWPCRVWHG